MFLEFNGKLVISLIQLSGSIPTQLSSLKKLIVIVLQSNQLVDAPLLEVLDVRNNTLSSNVPPGTN
ncbi:putative leucine-rich repeat receptor-like protein kinase [Cucumis melo var. makuwa]|uniref:Putative leucine-rich repeat receptor-like protein kinase n=1 Tax=Cucumis melo var. makuwa TaxID=1194695 RepID=A0A5D3E1E5_CUCMM|nr:putative leucine-rich repeat receptor-like protein kinase [Cucumis melo var. makuwa]